MSRYVDMHSKMGPLCKGRRVSHTEEEAVFREQLLPWRGRGTLLHFPRVPPPTPASITKETGNRSFCPGTAFLLSVPSSVEHTEAPCRALDTLLWWSSRKVPCYQLLYSKRPEGGHGPRGGHDWAHAHSWEGSVSVLEQSVPTGWCSSLCSLLENSPQGLLACWWPWVRHPEKPFQLPQTGLPGYSGVIARSLIIDLIKGLGNKFLPFPHAG